MQQNVSLEEVKSHFDLWRATRKRRGKIPIYLWEKVKPLLSFYPLGAITHALNINTNQIRENIGADKPSINFVEVKSESQAPSSKQSIATAFESTKTCSIELHRANGIILKISAIPFASLPAIINQFMA